MNDQQRQLSRREALQRAGAILGGVVALPLSSAVLAGCNSRSGTAANWKPSTLTPEQNSLVTQIAELIIPETDTPGAREARVNEFIDLMLTDWYPSDERDHFLSGLTAVDELSIGKGGLAFMDMTEAEQVAVLTELEGVDSEGSELPTFFSMMKQLTLVGFYTSEIGATQEFNYVPIPGRYDGCVPVEEVVRFHA